MSIALTIAGIGCLTIYNDIKYVYRLEDRLYEPYRVILEPVRHRLKAYLKECPFILAEHNTYRSIILPHFPVHGLVAYKSGEYFQLNGVIAQEMLTDYDLIMASDNIDFIDSCCAKYGIEAAFVYGSKDLQIPGLYTVSNSWSVVYGDKYFRIYRKPRISPQ